MEIIVFKKSSTKSLLANGSLTLKEYRCKCYSKFCTTTLVNTNTINAFRLTRGVFGGPIEITSGYRCQFHNKKVGGISNSMHLIGSALDLRPAEKDFTAYELDRLENLAKLYFDVVIRYEGFIHCHMLDSEDMDPYLDKEQ